MSELDIQQKRFEQLTAGLCNDLCAVIETINNDLSAIIEAGKEEK